MQLKKLTAKVECPLIGLGTWELQGKRCVEVVREAYELGYRHFDTALLYGNHQQVAEGLRGAPREDLFITSKIPPSELETDRLLAAVERCLKELSLDYLDLLLIHWPNREIPLSTSFAALGNLLKRDKIQAAGVSNFTISDLKEALELRMFEIATNQVEYHPFLNQKRLLGFCNQNDIVLTAYSPLARGDVPKHETLEQIGKKYSKSAAEVSLRWLLQRGMVVIPKASSKEHLQQNLRALEWELLQEDCDRIELIGKTERKVNPDFAQFDGMN